MASMTYGIAVAAMAGWSGQRVTVKVVDVASAATLAVLQGEFALPMQLTESDEELPLQIGVGADGQVYLDREAFLCAEGYSDELTLRFGGSLVVLSRAGDSGSPS